MALFFRGLISVIVALMIIFLPDAEAFAADSGNGTVQEMLQQQKNGQKSQQNRGSSAATSSNATSTTLYGGSNLFLDFIKIVFSLLLVLALIYLLYRFAAKRTGRFKEGNHLKNLGGVSVGPNRSIQLIRLGNKVMVVGVGDNVQLLKEISEPSEIDALTSRTDAPDPIEHGVYKLLSWTSGKEDVQPDRNRQALMERLRSFLDVLKRERSEKMSEFVREARKK
ncbi:flagellar biosynthetic protein FliO [Sporolactobacillus vineae]|uniref:flagellar biosynthetic protein FliO n=1 Tax=Sporolactobacillus vineae TaxID=444463 RepID=UPI000287B42A|nr:flagellar biosynthetic protein FliO [Sporolactobacillus vineae]